MSTIAKTAAILEPIICDFAAAVGVTRDRVETRSEAASCGSPAGSTWHQLSVREEVLTEMHFVLDGTEVKNIWASASRPGYDPDLGYGPGAGVQRRRLEDQPLADMVADVRLALRVQERCEYSIISPQTTAQLARRGKLVSGTIFQVNVLNVLPGDEVVLQIGYGLADSLLLHTRAGTGHILKGTLRTDFGRIELQGSGVDRARLEAVTAQVERDIRVALEDFEGAGSATAEAFTVRLRELLA